MRLGGTGEPGRAGEDIEWERERAHGQGYPPAAGRLRVREADERQHLSTASDRAGQVLATLLRLAAAAAARLAS